MKKRWSTRRSVSSSWVAVMLEYQAEILFPPPCGGGLGWGVGK